MKAYNQNIKIEKSLPQEGLKSRERSAFDGRGGDPASEYAFDSV